MVEGISGIGTWDFKTLSARNDSSKIIDLSSEQQIKIPQYHQALTTAISSKVSSPTFSNYFVKESVVNNSKTIPAGNIEYGHCQALHGEESAVAAFRSFSDDNNTKDLVLGIVAGKPGDVPNPCGNCRDIMIDTFGTDFEIASGAPEGGLAIVTPMQTLLFEEPKEITSRIELVNELDMYLDDFKKLVNLTVTKGKDLTNDAYSPSGINPERKYYALIMTGKKQFFGGRDVMVDYHPIYALRDAIRQSRRAKDPFIKRVIIVAEEPDITMPHVMYKDRQHLLELNLQAELVKNKQQDPPVFLVSLDESGKLNKVWKTSVKQWLPFPFNPGDFGNEFVKHLSAYHKSKTK